jgi:DNA-binding beta-propeller fold protein YncE
MSQSGSGPPHALLRAGFPYVKTIGMIRTTPAPVDIAIGTDRRLYVLCRGREGGIFPNSWDDDYPQTRVAIGGKGTGDGELIWPTAVILDSEENLYVADDALDAVTVFDNEGGFLRRWGKHGDGDGEFDHLASIAFDPDDNIYASDTLNHRVQKMTKDGRFLASWGEFGDGPGQFNMPWGIEVDDWGFVYVVDWRNDRVQKFTADGKFVFSLGSSGGGDGEFKRPSGVAVDKDGDIYVVDRENHRVQLFSKEGRYVEKFIGDATVSRSGRLYLINNPGPLRQRESTDLEPQKRFRGPVSVRVDDGGAMYVSDYGSSRVQIYQKEAYPLGPNEIAPPQRSPKLYTM